MGYVPGWESPDVRPGRHPDAPSLAYFACGQARGMLMVQADGMRVRTRPRGPLRRLLPEWASRNTV